MNDTGTSGSISAETVPVMVERVARALRRTVLPDAREPGQDWMAIGYDVRMMYRREAVAAIKALREPTEAMINSPMARCYNDGPFADKEVRRIFSSMIDEALK